VNLTIQNPPAGISKRLDVETALNSDTKQNSVTNRKWAKKRVPIKMITPVP
jgi:hypothetical protein